MPIPAASAGPHSAARQFWHLWEKTWWLYAILFLAANVWCWKHFGVLVLLQFWAAFFALVGAGTLLYARRACRLAEESVHWFPVQARILRSEVVCNKQRSFHDESLMHATTI